MAVRIEDGLANPLTSTNGALDINVKSSSGGIAVTNFPATQSISAAALPLPSGAAQDGTDGTGITPPNGAVGIRGWLSGIYKALLGTLTVAVTNFPATQSVSGTVAVNNLPATQTVSGAVTANVGTTGGLALDATLTGGTQKTKLIDAGGANVAIVDATGDLQVDVNNFPVTQAVSAASLPLPTGAATSANQQTMGTAGAPSTQVASVQGVASGTPVSISGTVAVSNLPATQPISAASLPLPANASQETGGNLATIALATTNGSQKSQIVNGSGTVADVQPKGTQGVEFLAVQQPKDSGRSSVILSVTRATGVTTEAVANMTIKKGTAGISTGTSYTVTTGKNLRIQSLFVSILNSTAAINNVVARLRQGASGGGAATVTSDIMAEVETASVLATIASGNSQSVTFPDGLEIQSAQVLAISTLSALASGTVTIVLVGYEY